MSLKYIIFVNSMNTSAISTVRNILSSRDKGEVFVLKDFSSAGSEDAVKKALSRLCSSGELTRLGRGIYCALKTDDVFGFGKIYPPLDQVARAVARSEGISIIPTTEYAMNAMNLSTQIQTNSVFLTDGCRRHIRLNGYKGNGITFVHSSNSRLFKITNRRMLLIILSMIGIGERNLDEDRVRVIKSHLVSVSLQEYLHDIQFAPVWIQKKLIS